MCRTSSMESSVLAFPALAWQWGSSCDGRGSNSRVQVAVLVFTNRPLQLAEGEESRHCGLFGAVGRARAWPEVSIVSFGS